MKTNSYESQKVPWKRYDQKNELMNPPYKDSTNFMISNLKLDHTGPPSPLRAVDRDILAVRMDELNMCGFGLDISGMSTLVK